MDFLAGMMAICMASMLVLFHAGMLAAPGSGFVFVGTTLYVLSALSVTLSLLALILGVRFEHKSKTEIPVGVVWLFVAALYFVPPFLVGTIARFLGF